VGCTYLTLLIAQTRGGAEVRSLKCVLGVRGRDARESPPRGAMAAVGALVVECVDTSGSQFDTNQKAEQQSDLHLDVVLMEAETGIEESSLWSDICLPCPAVFAEPQKRGEVAGAVGGVSSERTAADDHTLVTGSGVPASPAAVAADASC
jgi:hypothetical protein